MGVSVEGGDGMKIGSLVEISTFCQNSHHNLKIAFTGLTLWFSYEECIAFKWLNKMVICENRWNKTTGKHLNAIDRDKKLRVNFDNFRHQLTDLTTHLQIYLSELP